ncbi:uncharacterized protein E0L32_004833 [Thyridium curvatum]|uniref:Mitochondrial ATP-dependent helicase irc3 n=1 Tax=Thyridium curvatum TaxID=1093900 RepID=A0A507B5A7_9PEZI|nr:uncharacterized protein E0L32_004833 [Thyridium curvatum]TPX15003.1 hypothetical protein E0L32_004833 [Thyridium curvatum]
MWGPWGRGILRSVHRRGVKPLGLPGVILPVLLARAVRRWRSNEVLPDGSLPKILLRDYQEDCIQSVLDSLENGHKRLGISLATGAGKTVIFTQLIDRVQPVSPSATQTLILAHRRELVEQAARHCTRAYPDKTVEIEMGSLHASGAADITIASVQSIISGDRIAKFDPSRFKLVLVDEAHHIVAPGYLKTLGHFGLESKREDSPHLVGVSATFSRFDGLRLGTAIDEIVYHKDYVDMIKDNWLSDVTFTTVESSADVSRVKSQGDFNAAQLSRAVNTDQVNEITVRSWLAKANGRKSTLVFCVDLAHVAGLTQKFRDYGIDARFVTGDTHKVERSDCLEAFKRREFPVLVNCGVFTEGTDIPNIDCVVLARPTKSRNLLVQMIGRGMRLHPEKDDCHVIDMVCSLETGVVTTPTLFGLDPGELVNNASVDELRKIKDRQAAENARAAQVYDHQRSDGVVDVKKVTFTEYSSVMDLIADTSDEKHIRAISQYAWVGVGSEKYILAGPTGTYLRLERTIESGEGPAPFRLYEIRALPPGVAKSPFAAPREIAKATTFSDAVHAGDKYASEIFPHSFVSRSQRWRNSPPTAGQLKFLNKLRGKAEELTEDDVTKGQAMDMITKLKHGARGRFAGLEADRRRRERQSIVLEREQARRQGEHITVGPVVM